VSLPAQTPSSPHGSRRARARLLGDVLLLVGGLLLSYPYWSSAYAHVQQDRLEDTYERAAESFRATVADREERPRGVSPEERVRRLAEAFADTLETGDPVGRLKIPAIDVNRTVQHGVRGPQSLDPDGDRALLRSGPVHYGDTPLPGAGEPFAVSGHRTTYGAPFNRLGELEPGDTILVDTPYARFRYTVAKLTVVEPTDTSVLLDRGYGLVLTTCTPMYSASHRLIVWAKLRSFTIFGERSRPSAGTAGHPVPGSSVSPAAGP
jgi:sortase A